MQYNIIKGLEEQIPLLADPTNNFTFYMNHFPSCIHTYSVILEVIINILLQMFHVNVTVLLCVWKQGYGEG